MPTIVWALLLLVLAVVFFVLELLVPSGGLISILAACSVIAAIVVMVVYEGPMAGALFFTGTMVGLPFVLFGIIRWLPDSFIGRIILNLPPADELSPHQAGQAGPEELVGMRGIAKTKMLPSGAITIEGRSYDAVSQGTAIEQGEAVEVVAVQGYRIVVRPTGEDRSPNDAPPTSNRNQATDALDAVIPDPFDDAEA